MRTLLKIVGTLVALFLAYFAYWHYQYQRSERDATQFCASIAEGTDAATVISRAEALHDARHGYMDGKSLYIVSFKGPIFNAFICEISLTGDKVVSRRVTALED